MAYLGPGLRRRRVGCAWQIHIEQDGVAWFLRVESDRHPIDNQCGQGHRHDVQSLVRWIGIEPEPDIPRLLIRRRQRLEACFHKSHRHSTPIGELVDLKGIEDRFYLFR